MGVGRRAEHAPLDPQRTPGRRGRVRGRGYLYLICSALIGPGQTATNNKSYHIFIGCQIAPRFQTVVVICFMSRDHLLCEKSKNVSRIACILEK